MFVLEVVYAGAVFLSNPINLFPVYESLYKTAIVKSFLEDANKRETYLIKFIIRIIVIVLCFFVCFYAPNFINFISFVGSFLFAIIGLYVPVGLLDIAELFLF